MQGFWLFASVSVRVKLINNQSKKGILLKNFRENPLVRNFTLLVACILIFSFLVHHLTSGQTLSEYASQSSMAAESSAVSANIPSDGSTSADTPSADTPSADTPSADTASPAISSGNSFSADAAEVEKNRVTYQDGFYYEPLSENLKKTITGSSYPADPSTARISYDSLRYVHVLYIDFNGASVSGDLICNKTIAQDLVEIFYTLYQKSYPIERISLVDNYGADDEASMEADNTSCFNYRPVAGSDKLSKHAYGLAIDLNPLYNPEVQTASDGTQTISPHNGTRFADRSAEFEHKITTDDAAYQAFTSHGFTWGGDWHNPKDYQHFQYTH